MNFTIDAALDQDDAPAPHLITIDGTPVARFTTAAIRDAVIASLRSLDYAEDDEGEEVRAAKTVKTLLGEQSVLIGVGDDLHAAIQHATDGIIETLTYYEHVNA